jgi:methionine-rich copper-binding protein CopC
LDELRDYARIVAAALRTLEAELRNRYGENWRLRIERESPGVWRCRWDVLSDDGQVIGGGGESFTYTSDTP